MKVGTFVEHIQWGKGIIIEELPIIANYSFPPAVRVLWNNPRTMKNGQKMTTLKVYEKNLTIISEVAE
jgi:CRISPR/Cas system-associated protein Cas5 (RAMP superfamily)